ncbi:MAG: hypothetical protein CM1200mP2_08380 [Planctomycetaceae bacterium]|nr:MAG: hypothetical protein CM1200mP2_08380 [Planctomycetaceae bacterium]
MTFIGKMLIVVQLVLSLLFMAFAGAYSPSNRTGSNSSPTRTRT